MCNHTEVLQTILEGVTENGAPIYAPTTSVEMAVYIEHVLTCYSVQD